MDEPTEATVEEPTGDYPQEEEPSDDAPEASAEQDKTPEEKLAKLQRKQENQQRRLDELEQKKKATDDAVAELEKQIGDVDKIVDKYKDKRSSFEESVQDLEGYSAIKTAMIDAIVDEQDVQAIEGAIAEVEGDIGDKQELVETQKGELDDAVAAEKAAKGALQDRQTDWDATANHQATIQANLDKIKELRSKIESEEEAEAYAVMYYYMGQLNDCLAETKVLTTTTPDDLRTQLHDARAAIKDAEEAYAQAILDREAAEEALEEAQKDLDEAEAARLGNILGALRDIEIKP